MPEKLIPFIAHAKEDTPIVVELASRLKAEGWIDPWYAEEDILPGQAWEGKIVEAVEKSHAVIVFLSTAVMARDGFFHKEIRLALDTAEEKPDGTIFIIPVRLDDCEVPTRLSVYQYVDYFGDGATKERTYTALRESLRVRAEGLGLLQ